MVHASAISHWLCVVQGSLGDCVQWDGPMLLGNGGVIPRARKVRTHRSAPDPETETQTVVHIVLDEPVGVGGPFDDATGPTLFAMRKHERCGVRVRHVAFG